MSEVRLSKNEKECMSAFRESEEGYGLTFKGVEANCELEKRLIRRTVRACARKGLLIYGRALFDDGGEFVGGGYCITKEGVAYFDSKPTPEDYA